MAGGDVTVADAGSRPVVRVDVLGPLEVTGPDGVRCTPTGALQRRLLALLVLRRGRVVSTDEIAEAMWPERLPEDHVAAVHTHVFRLRRRVPDLEIERCAPGYRLDPLGVDLDLDRFEDAVARSPRLRRDDPAAALGAADLALASWRGRPFPDLDESDDARIEVDRLEELHRRATEARVAALLDLGRVDEAVIEAEAMIVRDPLRERPRDLAMRALVAAGRRADALRVFDDVRRRLAEELGIDPSASLRRLNDEILAGADLGIDTTSPGPSPAGIVAGGGGTPPAGAIPVAARPPRPSRPLIGRSALAAELDAAIERASVVTLVGTGGVGKTSLAIDAADRLAGRFPAGVRFVELAGSEPGTVHTDVLGSLGVEPRSGVRPGHRIAATIGAEPSLLVLDNCEHVLDEVAPLVEDLVRRAAGVRVLATSRERLRVADEVVVTVAPLAYTGGPGATDGTAPQDPPAVRLFVERARDVGVVLDVATAPVVADICRRLDGLPLAIELAANRLVALRPEEILDGLDDRLRLLSGGRRSVPRHESMAAALDWSLRLLDDRLRGALDQISVFASPFSTADAAAVVGAPTTDVVTLLADLVERSLLHRVDHRFVMLEPVRQFVDAGFSDVDRRHRRAVRHAERFADVAEQIALDVRTDRAAEAFARARVLVPDLRAAYWTALANGDLGLAARLCTSLRDPAFLAMVPDLLAWPLEVGEAAARTGHESASAMFGLAALGAWKSGDLEASARHLRTAASEAERCGIEVPYVVVDMRGTLAAASGDLDRSAREYERALATTTGREDPVCRSETAATLAATLGYRHDPGAPALAERLLDEWFPSGCPVGQAWCWYGAGEAVLTTDPQRARDRLATSVEVARASGATFVEAVAGASLASIEVRHGDPNRAASTYRWLLPLMQRDEAVSPLWTALRAVTELLARAGANEGAAVLLGAVTSPRLGKPVFGDDAVLVETLRGELAGRLGADAFERSVARGAEFDDAAATSWAAAALDEHLPS